jgi:hypothetical protein
MGTKSRGQARVDQSGDNRFHSTSRISFKELDRARSGHPGDIYFSPPENPSSFGTEETTEFSGIPVHLSGNSYEIRRGVSTTLIERFIFRSSRSHTYWDTIFRLHNARISESHWFGWRPIRGFASKLPFWHSKSSGAFLIQYRSSSIGHGEKSTREKSYRRSDRFANGIRQRRGESLRNQVLEEIIARLLVVLGTIKWSDLTIR